MNIADATKLVGKTVKWRISVNTASHDPLSPRDRAWRYGTLVCAGRYLHVLPFTEFGEAKHTECTVINPDVCEIVEVQPPVEA